MRARMTMAVVAAVAAASAAVAAQQAGTQPAGQQASATAELRDREGKSVGTARFQETPHGLLLTLDFQRLPPGEHAVHLHETGKCDPPDFKTAGGHFNPTGAKHGYLDPKGPHAGDMPNIHVPKDGGLKVEYILQGLNLKGAKGALLDADGTAVVVHAKPDDYRTDPAGDAGDRLACGMLGK